MDFGTLLIHNGHDYEETTGAIGVPVIQTSTFAQTDIDAHQEYDYARSGNPTRKALEDIIAQLEGGARGFAFGSGMAATSSVLGIFAAGDHVIVCEDIYGGTWRILNTFYRRFGLEATLVDTTNLDNIRKAVKPNTKALFLESPSNPLLKITDLRAASAIAKEHGLITIVDNTFATPYLQRPLELGADIVVHSATKFLGGHSDVILGLAVTATDALGRRVYAVQNGFGAVPAPWDIWLTIRGIKTLKVRLDAEQETAGKIARWLSTHPNVAAVSYPGLETHHGAAIHARQSYGGGAVLSFKTKTTAVARQFLSKTKLAAPAVSLGGVETIASYPVTMSHAAMPLAEREQRGITDTLIRISCGLETAEDLIADFDEALR
ncbi:MAG: aminotransferase class I/II-fold pyridoxal phosphate-dependent enzyme [Spirochaetaceae bacterium]|jgi:cystathionine beta-lyase|nr:aminotransferase class I/II-fold pyridoxal phosphate-dependent enzyme [Spirochaetaceae bacterium]